MNRRGFLKTVAAAAAVAQFPHHLYAAEKPKLVSDKILLGPKKLEMSRLAMGTGTNASGKASNQTRMGLDKLTDLFKAALDEGVNFWDSADQYGSHPNLAHALKNGVAREKVVILTKTHAKTEKEMRADLDRFRKELNTDYIDIMLLHCMTSPEWNVNRRGAMDVISEAQEKGIIKTKGVSCHSLEALQTAAKEPWVEVDLARINPIKAHMDADVKTVESVLREMKKAGKGVIGMKVLGQGAMCTRQDEAVQYVLSLDCVDTFTVGFESRDEFTDLSKRIKAASTRG